MPTSAPTHTASVDQEAAAVTAAVRDDLEREITPAEAGRERRRLVASELLPSAVCQVPFGLWFHRRAADPTVVWWVAACAWPAVMLAFARGLVQRVRALTPRPAQACDEHVLAERAARSSLCPA